jgi:predicted outer membrane protein
MQRRTSRNLSRAVIVAVILAVGATIWQSWTAGTPGMSGVVQTSWGPLAPSDRDLLVKVRLACLWEMSTGQQAQQQATNPAVKEAARKITAEHTELDQKVREAADKLGVLLPSTPSAQQIGWMKEITAATGSDYDQIVVQRLREAHGIVLPLITTVRVGTRNSLVRTFAADTQEYVTRHIGYLESTGLVNYSALPDTPSPGLLSGAVGWRDLIVPGLVLIACLLVAVALGATLRSRNASRKDTAAVAPAVSQRPLVATAKSLIALPEAPVRVRDLTRSDLPGNRQVTEDDVPTGSFPQVGSGTGGFASVSSPVSPPMGSPVSAPSTTGGFAATAGRVATTGGVPSTRTPGRGVPYPSSTAVSPGVNDTGPRHAVRR